MTKEFPNHGNHFARKAASTRYPEIVSLATNAPRLGSLPRVKPEAFGSRLPGNF